jgi:tetratricopeptide (TPR) repeat protein
MIDMNELRAKIAEGASIEQLLTLFRGVETAIPEPIWRRCAILRYFDEILYDRCIVLGVDAAPTFSQLASRPEVEPKPGGSIGRYALRDEPRARYIKAWLEYPEELAEYASTLVAHYREAGEGLDAFTHRLLCEPDAALGEFQERYTAADRGFDLATCDALLHILRNRTPLLRPKLRATLADREVYLRSRTLFAEDYYRTLLFQPRNEALADFEWVLKDRRAWLLQIYGAGGVGKSLLLQWLIARHCVEEHDGRRLPVARIDFDRIDLISLGAHPWLVLLPIAQQLTRQLPTNPFRELLIENDPIVGLLESVGAGRDGSVNSERSGLAEALATGEKAEAVPRQFAAVLADTRAVVAFDTAEEALLHQPVAFAGMLEMFGRMHSGGDSARRCPGLNLIVAGRYDLREPRRLPEFMNAHADRSRSTRLGAFTEPEAHQYLSELRRIDDPKIITAIYRRTAGDPFATALFADLWHTNQSGLTAEKIRDYPSFEYAYLIDRIIERIPEHHAAIQWLLRYAVIPRHLTKAFFSEVLLPYMPSQGGQATARDDPNRFPAAARQFEEKRPWNPLTPFDVDSLWRDLSLYSSPYGWISITEDVVRLQPEVVHPMRLLLQNNPVDPTLYDDLHSAAETYFAGRAERAETEGKPWAEWAGEAVYHRFQRVGATAHDLWRHYLDRAQSVEDRERLAATVLESEFLDDRKPRAHPKTSTIVGYRTVGQSSFELANVALLRRLRLRPDHPLAEDYERERRLRWADALEYEQLWGERIIPLPQRSLMWLAQRIFGPPTAAQPANLWETVANLFSRTADIVVREAARLPERTVADPLLKLTTKFLLAYANAPLKPERADGYLRQAYALAQRTGSVNLPTYAIDLLRGRAFLAGGNLVSALEVLERAYRQAMEKRPNPPETAEALRLLVEAAVAAGRFAQASSYTDEAGPADEEVRFQAAISASIVDLRRGRAIAARARLSNPSPGEDGSLTGTYRRALRAEIAADVDARLMAFTTAEAAYHNAQSLYVSAGRINAPRNCLLKLARLDITRGNFAGAVRRLAELENEAAFTDPELAVEHRLLTLQCLAPVDPSDARDRWAGLRDGAAENRSPRLSARVLATGLALGLADPEADSRSLLERLRAIEPVTARYPVLSVFRLFASASGDGASGVESLLAAVPRPDAADEDFAVQALPLADALRFFGAGADAVALLRKALSKTEEPLLRRDIRLALVRSGQCLPEPWEVPAFLSCFADYPALCGARLLEEAEILYESEAFDRARELVEEARQKLENLGSSTQWNLRVEELRGHLAGADGDHPRALARFRRALGIAHETGAPAATVDRLTRTIETIESNAATPPLSAANDFALAADILDISVVGDEVEIRAVPLHGSGSQFKFPMSRSELQLEARDSQLLMFGRIPDLTRLLPEAADRELPVALRIPPGFLSGPPWEFFFLRTAQRRFAFRDATTEPSHNESIRWVQLCLAKAGYEVVVDGIYGPQTARALKAFATAMAVEGTVAAVRPRLRGLDVHSDSLSAPMILIVQRNLEEERLSARGHGAFGIELEFVYRRYGFESLRTPRIDPAEFGAMLLAIRPAVIHIVSGFFSDGGDVFLDLGRKDSAPTGALLSAARLDSLLRGWPRHLMHPLIVLEAVRPPDPAERFRQLLLRNMFAAQLFANGKVRGVLGVGFGVTPEPAVRTLAAGLSERRSLRELYTALLDAEFTPPPSMLPASLFTTDPDLPSWI